MEKLAFDIGVKEYQIEGGGILRFNPGDPNIYARFLDTVSKLETMEKDMSDQAGKLDPEDGAGVLRILQQTDRDVKKLLSWIFGEENDFDKILGGVNTLAVGSNGERVVTNFLLALEPILTAGAKQCSAQRVQTAVGKANARRSAQ